ncbi:MAG: bifunctional riboflavin kinase/FAD synthetase [Nitrospirae bacterium]|nr:MAG: bifunctional riboflavin kinase/FAD synthetase [Nitrospirota bacterium]
MDVIRSPHELSAPLPYPVVTIGNYDGVHLGHQEIFRRVRARADATGGTAVVVTFDPHPLKVLAPERCPPIMVTCEQKLRLIEAHGIDLVVCQRFTREFAAQPPHRFARDYLARGLGARWVVVGYDYSFGRGREGTIDSLRELGLEHGFELEVVPPVEVEGEIVSSTRVRQLITAGRLTEANRCLGRPYSIAGEVIHGDRRGRTLGFPTANIRSTDGLLPARGVYAIRVAWRGRFFDGVLNLGVNPTFGAREVTIEPHLFDFHEDLYGQTIEVYFIKRLRDEIRFPSAEALVAQIERDVAEARAVLAACPDPLTVL